MMKTGPHRITAAAQDLVNIDEVQAVYSVSGNRDLVAIVKTPDLEHLG